MTTTRVIFLGDGDAASERSCYRYRIGETVVALYLAYRVIGGNGDWPISIMYAGRPAYRAERFRGFPDHRDGDPSLSSAVVVCIGFIQDAASIDVGQLGRIGAGDVATLGSLSDGTPVQARADDLDSDSLLADDEHNEWGDA